jgi:hypothetical protein
LAADRVSGLDRTVGPRHQQVGELAAVERVRVVVTTDTVDDDGSRPSGTCGVWIT